MHLRFLCQIHDTGSAVCRSAWWCAAEVGGIRGAVVGRWQGDCGYSQNPGNRRTLNKAIPCLWSALETGRNGLASRRERTAYKTTPEVSGAGEAKQWAKAHFLF